MKLVTYRELIKYFMRLLQSGDIRRVGSNDVKKLNVQIIAATNKDINDEKIFASDLKDRFQKQLQYRPLEKERYSYIS